MLLWGNSNKETWATNSAKFYSFSVPDSIVLNVLKERLGQLDCVSRGWVLHGYPKTREQAEQLSYAGFVPNRYETVPCSLSSTISKGKNTLRQIIFCFEIHQVKRWLSLQIKRGDSWTNSVLLMFRVFFLDVPNDSVMERLTLRATDPVTGERYHMLYNPPRSQEIKERLEIHPRDNEDQVKQLYSES